MRSGEVRSKTEDKTMSETTRTDESTADNHRSLPLEVAILATDTARMLSAHMMKEDIDAKDYSNDVARWHRIMTETKKRAVSETEEGHYAKYRDFHDAPSRELWSGPVADRVSEVTSEAGSSWDNVPARFNITGYQRIPEDVAKDTLGIDYSDPDTEPLFIPEVDGKLFDPTNTIGTPEEWQADAEDEEEDPFGDDEDAPWATPADSDESEDEETETSEASKDVTFEELELEYDNSTQFFNTVAEATGHTSDSEIKAIALGAPAFNDYQTMRKLAGGNHLGLGEFMSDSPDTEELQETLWDAGLFPSPDGETLLADANGDTYVVEDNEGMSLDYIESTHRTLEREGTEEDTEESEAETDATDEPEVTEGSEVPEGFNLTGPLPKYIGANKEGHPVLINKAPKAKLEEDSDEDEEWSNTERAVYLKVADPSRFNTEVGRMVADLAGKDKYSGTSVSNALSSKLGEEGKAAVKAMGNEIRDGNAEAGELTGADIADEITEESDDEGESEATESETEEDTKDLTEGRGTLEAVVNEANVTGTDVNLKSAVIAASIKLSQQGDKRALVTLFDALAEAESNDE